MPNKSQLANVYVGARPPDATSAITRWISQSHAHMQIPCGPFERIPIIGNAAGNTSATQEANVWYNPATSRWEALVNTSSGQVFCSSYYAAGPWTVSGSQCLGNGNGGEAGSAQQCRHIIEGNTLYAYYMSNRDYTKVFLASSPMPTPAAPTPVFTYLGPIATRRTGVTGSNFIMSVGGQYLMFSEDGTLVLQASPATSAAGLVATPFTLISPSLSAVTVVFNGPYVLDVGQIRKWFGRPYVIYEDGLWILYLHCGFNTSCHVTRWTCKDPLPYPINWVQDKTFDYLRPMNQLEVDQLVDFTVAQGPNERWWAFWTAASNPDSRFTIMACPMRETMMAFDGSAWTPTMAQTDPRADLGYKPVDYTTNVSYTATNSEDVVCDTKNGNRTVVFPRATSGARLKVSNAPSGFPGNDLFVQPNVTGDTISSGNPIVAASMVGTTVTVTTRRAHGLSTSDFVTVGGTSPAASYNVNGAAITAVTSNSFSYVGGTNAANTALGVYESSLAPGESRRYRSRQFYLGNWIRD